MIRVVTREDNNSLSDLNLLLEEQCLKNLKLDIHMECDNMLTSTEDKLKEWNQFIQNLFNDDRTASHYINLNDGIDIAKAEVEHAIAASHLDLMEYT
ncbi:hypothetical protein HHI36_011577 [Cryptolaemus montrouzieri]|uniref:Uncharacterized protein n=1 Tax=Cryptolaemus montrouzieri TaxID=559131 RepID=A0ABD2MM21_9CUCU